MALWTKKDNSQSGSYLYFSIHVQVCTTERFIQSDKRPPISLSFFVESLFKLGWYIGSDLYICCIPLLKAIQLAVCT